MTLKKLIWFFVAVCTLFTVQAQSNKGSISGKVVDENGEDAIGVTIYLKEIQKGINTGITGEYEIKDITPGTYTLMFQYIGYKNHEQQVVIKAGERLKVDHQLKEDAELLDEVIVVGYGTTLQRDVTGSIEKIKSKDLENTVTPSFEQAMQGRAAGVQITSANGIAGAPIKVNIRGSNSIAAGSDPLYVIDGIPMTSGNFDAGSLGSGSNALTDLNPDDIESIEVLKDAAATAIYGSRGANGVVLITTKKGKEGKTKVKVSVSSGLVNAARKLEFLNASEMLALRDRAKMESGGVMDSPTTPLLQVNNGETWTRADADSLAALGGTNWVDEMLRTGVMQNLNLNASGGNKNLLFYYGGSYRKEQGFLKGNDYQRGNGRINLENKISDRLTIGTSVGLTISKNDRVRTGDAGGLGWAQQIMPYIPAYDENGDIFNPGANPLWYLESQTYVTNGFRSLANIYGNLKINKKLSFRSEFGYDYFNQVEYERNQRNPLDSNSTASSWDRRTNVDNWTTNNFFSYNDSIGDNQVISAILGSSVQSSYTKGVGLGGFNFVNDNLTSPAAADPDDRLSYQYETGYGFVSYFSRVNYKLKDKYLASFSIRRDGSSRFGDNNKFGWFPAISAGWIISEEGKLKDSEKIEFLKLRASYGFAGNANISDFAPLGFYTVAGGYLGNSGIAPSTLANPGLTWEKSKQLDISLEYALFSNRIFGNITYYNKSSYDLLLFVSLPQSTGFSGVLDNIGSLRNSGVEFTVSTKNVAKKNFTWGTDFNIAFNSNKITDVNGLPPDAFESGQPGEGRVIIDHPTGIHYVVESAGIQQQDGQIQAYNVDGTRQLNNDGTNKMYDVQAGTELYYDLNGNLMTFANPTGSFYGDNRRPFGNPVPKFIGGITNNLTYKNLDVSFMFSFVSGNTIYDDPAKNQIGMYRNLNQRTEINDSWTPENTNTNVPALNRYTTPVNSSRFVYDASYIRLRSLSVGYNLPKKRCVKWKIESARVFLNGSNLWLITKFPGWDPEVLRNVDPNSQQGNVSFAGPSLQTPQARIFTAGVKVGF